MASVISKFTYHFAIQSDPNGDFNGVSFTIELTNPNNGPGPNTPLSESQIDSAVTDFCAALAANTGAQSLAGVFKRVESFDDSPL